MEKKYVSIDVETSGSTPGKYSMLSIGACIVGNKNKKFYRELKPLNHNYVYEAMKVGCLGLHVCRLQSNPEFHPEFKSFNPKKVLEKLSEMGTEPSTVFTEFAAWIRENTKGYKPIELAAPIKFDGMFTAWYFDNFYDGENPLSYNGEDIGSFYRGFRRNVNAKIENLQVPEERVCKHNALEDAIQQAKEFETILKLIKE